MKAFVLVTALPPTKGHMLLIEFASQLADRVEVILSTQPDEPFGYERHIALTKAVEKYNGRITINRRHEKIEQNSGAEGFWPMWLSIMKEYGCRAGDVIVSSEPYGKKLAELTGARFMPYDPDRSILKTKATNIRNNPKGYFKDLLPEFQPFVRQTVTVFGAESTGKTTLSKELARMVNGWWIFEYARPYLEIVGTEINNDSMTAIWKGQHALQQNNVNLLDKPWVIQDTDLYSTVGYWDGWCKGKMFPGSDPTPTPKDLIYDASVLKSDLYIVTNSDIPFEKDAIRYGNDKRESDDQYWIDVCENFNLNYRVLTATNVYDRLDECYWLMIDHWRDNVQTKLKYEREFNS